MSHGLDLEHQRRLRAERVLDTLRLLWGDELPPGPNPHLSVLIDAVAADDAHGAENRLVCQGDGLDLQTVATLWRHYLSTTRTGNSRPATGPSGSAAGGAAEHAPALPDGLLARLPRAGAFDGDARRSSTDLPTPPPARNVTGESGGERTTGSTAPATPPTAHFAADVGAGACVGVWHLDATTGTVTYDALGAQLIGAGTAGHDRVDAHLEKLIHPDDKDAIARQLQHALHTGEDYRQRFRVVSPAGEVTWLFSHGRVVHAPVAAPGAPAETPTRTPQLIGFIRADHDGSSHPGPASSVPSSPSLSS